MSQQYDTKLEEWCKWWDEHKNDGGDLEQKVKLLQRTIEGFYTLFAHISRDMRDLEGRPRESLGRAIWTPGPITVRGDVKKFG